MKNILEVQMLRYSKIMLGNCCNIRSSLLSSIMSCPQWVIKSPDWPNHSFFKFLTTTKLFSPTLPLHTLLPSPSCPLQSPMVGWILDCVPGPTSIGRSQNFIQLVTGHTPGWINRNGTVLCLSGCFSIFGDHKSLLARGSARLYFFRGKLKEGTME